MRKDTHIHAMILRQDVDSHAYVRAAIAKGLDTIAITDHMPLSCSSAGDRIPRGRVNIAKRCGSWDVGTTVRSVFSAASR